MGILRPAVAANGPVITPPFLSSLSSRFTATALANENDMKGMANIILLGKLLKETNITSMETVKKAMEKVIPPKKAHLIEANIKAIELGMQQ